MDPITTSRRSFLGITLAAGAGVGLAACGGTSGPQSSGTAAGGAGAATGSASYWFLTGQPGEAFDAVVDGEVFEQWSEEASGRSPSDDDLVGVRSGHVITFNGIWVGAHHLRRHLTRVRCRL